MPWSIGDFVATRGWLHCFAYHGDLENVVNSFCSMCLKWSISSLDASAYSTHGCLLVYNYQNDSPGFFNYVNLVDDHLYVVIFWIGNAKIALSKYHAYGFTLWTWQVKINWHNYPINPPVPNFATFFFSYKIAFRFSISVWWWSPRMT